MAGEANLTTSAAILKTKYTQPKVYWIAYKKNPEIATVRKDVKFGGANKVIAIQNETPQGAGSSIATAQASLAAGAYNRFTITRIEDFGVARVKGQALRAAQGNDNALLDLWTREMDGILHTVTRSLAINFWRTGTGTRGVIATSSTLGSTTITLAQPSDAMSFAVNMFIQVTATDGGAPIAGGATAQITGLDRTAGTLTLAVNWNAAFSGIAVSNFIIRNGDSVGATVAGANTMITGMGAWIPQSTARPASNDSFFGLNRFSDPTRLAGQYLNASGIPMQEALLEGLALTSVEGAEVDVAWVHPRDKANLVKELGAKVQYTRVDAKVPNSDAKIGFDAIEIESDMGKCKVMTSINVPRNTSFLTQWDTWAIESLGPAPMVLDFDSNDFLRVSNDDQYEVRVGYYAQMSCGAPGFNCNMSNFGL